MGNIFPLFLWHVQLEQIMQPPSKSRVTVLCWGIGPWNMPAFDGWKERISSNASELIFEIGGFQAFCRRWIRSVRGKWKKDVSIGVVFHHGIQALKISRKVELQGVSKCISKTPSQAVFWWNILAQSVYSFHQTYIHIYWYNPYVLVYTGVSLSHLVISIFHKWSNCSSRFRRRAHQQKQTRLYYLFELLCQVNWNPGKRLKFIQTNSCKSISSIIQQSSITFACQKSASLDFRG